MSNVDLWLPPEQETAVASEGGGTIGICAQETGRYSDFTLSLANLHRPPGWEVLAGYGCDIADSRHQLVERFLFETAGEYLFFIDDDHVFEPDLLERLLAHRKDVVGPLCLKKLAPFRPANFVGFHNDVLDRPPGLREVGELGASGLLVHRRVFAKLEPPYFWPPGEDFGFCQRVRGAGFEIFIDTSTWLGHLTRAAVWPHYEDGRWEPRVEFGDRIGVSFPYAGLEVDEESET